MAKKPLKTLELRLQKGLDLDDTKRKIAITALNHFKDKFTAGNQQWEGQGWEEPQRRIRGAIRLRRGSGYRKGFTPARATEAILVDDGVLSKSLRFDISRNDIIFSSNVAYADRHNRGTNGMPQRQFVGMETDLKVKIRAIIGKGIGDIMEGK